MARGVGLPSASQAAVQDDFSCRENLPVRALERIVSPEVAWIIFSLTIGFVSASLVVSHTDPVQAPAAPMAIHAAIWRPVTIPPAAKIGTFPKGCMAS